MTAPSVTQIEAQIHHELGCIEEGKRRYQRMVAETAFSDTRPGLAALTDMLGSPLSAIRKGGPSVKQGLIYAIDQLQSEAVGAMEAAVLNSNGSGPGTGPKRFPDWYWLIGLLDAEKLALITARTMLNSNWRTDQLGRGLPSLALQLSTAVAHEIEFEAWQVKSADQEFDLARIMITKTGHVDQKTFQRWRKKLRGTIDRLNLDRSIRLAFGTVLIDLGVRHGGGWFELRTVYSRGKRSRRLFLTAAAFAAISDIDSRLEVSRPLRLPMICKPKPWRRTNAE